MAKTVLWAEVPPDLKQRVDAFGVERGLNKTMAIRVLVLTGLEKIEAMPAGKVLEAIGKAAGSGW